MEKPKNVKISVNLVWLSIAVSPFQFEFEPGKTAIAEQPGLFLVLVVNVAILALLNYKVAAGRNWARWVMLVLAALTAFSAVNTVTQLYAAAAFASIAVYVVQAGLQIAALVLVFTKPGSDYFRKPATTAGAASPPQ